MTPLSTVKNSALISMYINHANVKEVKQKGAVPIKIELRIQMIKECFKGVN